MTTDLDFAKICLMLKRKHGECMDEHGKPMRIFNYGTLVVENGNGDNEWILVPLSHCQQPVRQIYLLNGELRVKNLNHSVEIPHHESLLEMVSQYNRTPGHVGTFLAIASVNHRGG